MSLPVSLAVCVGGVVCCSLLSLYLLWLAGVHRRDRPTVLAGPRDLACLLLGLSGFLLAGGPLVAAAGQTVAGQAVLSWDAARDRTGVVVAAGYWCRAGYAGLVTAAVLLAVLARRDTLTVYNLDPAGLSPLLTEATAAVGLTPDAVRVLSRPTSGHAELSVRHLDRPAAAELLRSLRSRLRAGPPALAPVGGWLTAAAAGLLGCTFALLGAFLKRTGTI